MAGGTVLEIYSQDRDVLVLEIALQNGDTQFIKVSLRPELAYMAPVHIQHRARANTATLFENLAGCHIKAVIAPALDRRIGIELEAGLCLWFLFYGTRSDAVLCQELTEVNRFKQKQSFLPDFSAPPFSAAKDLASTAFKANPPAAWQQFLALGTEPKKQLLAKGYAQATENEQGAQWLAMVQLLLAPPAYYVCQSMGTTRLLFWAEGDVVSTHACACAAATAWVQVVSTRFYADKTRNEAEKLLARLKAQTLANLQKVAQRLHLLLTRRPISQEADIVMAQLHLFSTGIQAQTRTLADFYTDSTVDITLKEGQTPQAYATTLYKKSKREAEEVQHLKETIANREDWLQTLQQTETTLAAAQDVKSIRQLVAGLGPLATQADEAPLPYRAVFFKGWEIRIGKNANSNDEMLRHHSHKEDLWLHAKSAAGSHVLVRHRPGMPYPEPVVEYAAALAAHHSKKRTETLADVSVTLRKYVRKPKGAPAGAVLIAQERVLLVRPQAASS